MGNIPQSKSIVNELSLKEAAIYYAKRGFRVVPAHSIIKSKDGPRCTCSNPNCKAMGKHPRTQRGQTDATTDLVIIERWWEEWPNANIQIIPQSKNLIVVDVDPKHKGDITWDRWHGLIAKDELDTFTVRSGSGGLHLYFQKPPKTKRIKNRADILGPGVDIKSTGLIVAPPSVHFSGNKYEVINQADSLILPDKIRKWALLPRKLENGGHVADGARNETLIKEIGGRLQGWRMEHSTIAEFLRDANEIYLINPLEMRELEAGIENVINNFSPGNGNYQDLGGDPNRHDDFEALANEIVSKNHFFLPSAKNAPLWYWNPTSGLWEETGDYRIDHLVGKWRFGLPNSEKKPDMVKILREVHAIIKSALKGKQSESFPLGNKYDIYFKNGILNWKTREFREEYTPEDYATCKVNVEYDPKATTTFIDDLFYEWVEPEMVPMLYEMIFLCFIRLYPVQKAFLLHGPGQDGKSVFISVVQELLGKHNVSFVKPQRLSENYVGATLYHKLANVCADIPNKDLKDTDELKKMTGGDIIQSRRPYKDFISFFSYATMIFSANEIPRTYDHSRGFFRRFQLIKFPNHIPEHKQDRLLVEKIANNRDDLRGVAAKVIEHGFALIDRGWKMTGEDSIEDTKQKYLEQSDPIEIFLQKFTKSNSAYSVSKGDFADSFNQWMKAHGRDKWTNHRVSRTMTMVKRIPIIRDQSGDMCYEHISIREIELHEEIKRLGTSEDALRVLDLIQKGAVFTVDEVDEKILKDLKKHGVEPQDGKIKWKATA